MKFRPGGIALDRVIRKFLPRSLFGRSLLTVLIPLVLLQVVALQIFYGSHLNELSRRLAGGVAGEVGFMVAEIDREPQNQAAILEEAAWNFDFNANLLAGAKMKPTTQVDLPGPVDNDLAAALDMNIDHQFNTDWVSEPGFIVVDVQMKDGVLHIEVPRKRLYVGTLYLFLFWLFGTAILVFGVAALFLRTQVRGISRLAAAAESLGMGREIAPIRPEGAMEVRRAATAFNRMAERLRRYLTQRTTMLAGVSHDLRTPLTRLRLALAMLPESVPAEEVHYMQEDIAEMESLIGIYLSFARGEGTEQPVASDVSALLTEVAATARRHGADVAQDVPEGLTAVLRPEAIRRAITNLVDNARRYAKHIWLRAERNGGRLRVVIDDDGPGIPAERRELMFRPFESAEPGGTGLGLAIARDIVGAHGGDILLLDRPGGGLRVVVELPG
jgi:two-component system osmolarity sensor histidine kinase EnvZ